VIREIEIGAAAIQKRTPRLPIGAREGVSIGRIKDQGSAPGKCIRPKTSCASGKVNDERSGHFVKVRFHWRDSASRDVLLRVSREPIIAFSSEPSTELIRISDEESAGLRQPVQHDLPPSKQSKRRIHDQQNPANQQQNE